MGERICSPFFRCEIMLNIGIYGASGYTGQELVRLLIRHPEARIAAITSRRYKDIPLADVYPVFTGLTDLVFIDASPEDVAKDADVIFLALPHGISMGVAQQFVRSGKKVVDLSADFRLHDINTYEKWYGRHTAPDVLHDAVYGIPELFREEIRKSSFVANPGCYPTSVILGLAPVLKNGCIDIKSVIVDSKSGVSGAGREPQVGSLFCEVSDGFKAYKVGGQHRHTPEIEQGLWHIAGQEVTITFTPHLLPVSRGILSTIYATLTEGLGIADLEKMYREFYQGEQFIRVYKAGTFPNISSVRGSNYCDIGVTIDARTNRLIVVSAIDNLIKGASGQAIQNMNLMCGVQEAAGLDIMPVFP
jgi:N-acetyl-gamma-glutamyl-phosphate reductase